MQPLSQRVGRIGPSQTVAIDTRYKQMLASGIDVLSLGAGEPDLPMPAVAAEAAAQSLRDGKTRYTSVTGLPELRAAIAEKFHRDNGIDCGPEDVLVTNGAKHAIFNALLALVEDGDEVIIPAPYWTTYPELVRFLGGRPVLAATEPERGFKLLPEQLAELITPRSKALILNSPGNPTGAAYTREELTALGEVILRHDLNVISDEIYEHITYGEFRHTSLASLSPELAGLTATVNGMSKSFAMTGLRIGYVTAPKSWLAAMSAIQSHGTHHPANVSQYAALACLTRGLDFLPTMRSHFDKARQFTWSRLAGLQDLKPFSPQGAFYAFCDIRRILAKAVQSHPEIETSLDLSRFLLERGRLATVPGSAFGCEGWLRLSFANSTDYLAKALDRLAESLRSLA